MHTSAIPLRSFKPDESIEVPPWEPAGTVDMFLPAIHLHKLALLRQDEGSMNHLFRLLLGRYRNRILRSGCERQAQYPRYREQNHPGLFWREPVADLRPFRMRYQYPGMKLKRISMRFEKDVWLELRLLSLATRCSMSRLMVLLVVWEFTRRYKFALRQWDPPLYGSVGTPTSSRLTLDYKEATRIYRITGHFSRSEPFFPPHWYTPPPAVP